MADGTTDTDLFMRGLETAFPLEWWNVEQPDDIIDFHPPFFWAIADPLLTNSFEGSALCFKLHEAHDSVAETNAAVARLAHMAADSVVDRHVRVLDVTGSMGPIGELFELMDRLTH